jgi:hypothetical protein
MIAVQLEVTNKEMALSQVFYSVSASAMEKENAINYTDIFLQSANKAYTEIC